MNLAPFYSVHEGSAPPAGEDVWWRADDRRYANYNPWDDECSGSHLRISYTRFVVDRYTPKGVWLRGFLGDTHFVLGTTLKQFAVPTKELALQDLVARKQRHVAGAKARLHRAEEHLAAAEWELQKLRATLSADLGESA